MRLYLPTLWLSLRCIEMTDQDDSEIQPSYQGAVTLTITLPVTMTLTGTSSMTMPLSPDAEAFQGFYSHSRQLTRQDGDTLRLVGLCRRRDNPRLTDFVLLTQHGESTPIKDEVVLTPNTLSMLKALFASDLDAFPTELDPTNPTNTEVVDVTSESKD